MIELICCLISQFVVNKATLYTLFIDMFWLNENYSVMHVLSGHVVFGQFPIPPE